jgi:uncharacterized protein YqjF (DUF2071 family)
MSPRRVTPLTVQRWDRLTFLHWRYPPELLADRLPRGLSVDTYDGSGWVSMTPFLLSVGPPGLPLRIRTPETNLRTYVRGPGGAPGIWFFSLDIANPLAAVTARLAYSLPYTWSEMSVSEDGEHLSYWSRRRVPAGAMTHIRIEIGRPLERGPLEDFLTARFRLFTRAGPVLLRWVVEHPPWPLQAARVLELEETLLSAAGLPAPREEPLAHFSPALRVRVGPPIPGL